MAGCLVAVVGGCVGFGVWLHGARRGIGGAFEGQRDWSLLYAELPLMLFGVPAVALTVWAPAYGTLRERMGRPAAAVVSGAAVVTTLAFLAWLSLAWLDARTAWVPPTGA